MNALPRTPTVLLLALLLPLAACGDAEMEEPITEEPITEEPAPMDEGALTTERNTVEVGLTEYEIDMPSSVPAGATTFSITNNGTMEHSFEIEGQGIEEALPSNLEPGGTAILDVTLQPGPYRVYCPVENHASEGMEMQLDVTPDDASTAATRTY